MFQNKLLTEIIDETGTIIKKKRFPVYQNKIQISKGQRGRGHPAVNVEFERESIIHFYKGIWPLRRLQKKVMVNDGASKCLIFKDKKIISGQWDTETEKKLFEANVIKSAGATVQKLQVPTAVYVLLVFILMLMGVQLLMNYRGAF